MQIIPALSNITNMPHIFETPDEIIINGQIYDTETLKPKPFCFFNCTNLLINFNLLNENVNRIGEKHSLCGKGVDYQNIIQDSENPDIFYVHVFLNGDSVTLRMLKIQKIENSYTILNTSYFSSPYVNYNASNMFKFICQTEKYVFISEAHRASDTWHDVRNVCIRRVSKKDLSSVYIINYANNDYPLGNYTDSACFGVSHYLIKKNESFLYLYLYFGETAYIQKYNIENNTWTSLYVFPAAYVNGYSIGASNIIEFNNKYYIFTGNESHTSYELQEINIDDNDVVTINHCPVSSPLFQYHVSGYRTINGTSHALTPSLIYTLKNIDNKYIGLTVHHNEGGCAITTNNKHIVIKKNTSGFEIADVIDIDSCFGVLYYDDYTSILLTQTGYHVYRLVNDKWKIVYEDSGTFYYIGFDKYKRFYAIDSANNITIHSNISLCLLDVYFAEANYNYTGTDIPSTCKIYAKNYLGDYVATSIKLTLTGNVIFPDGTKEKIIKTINTNFVQESIIIIGSGKIGINAIEMEV